MSIETELAEAIVGALCRAQASQSLPQISLELTGIDEIPLERPKNRDHGDFASSIALALAKKMGIKPQDVATALVDQLKSHPLISKIEIAGPGFINFTLNSASHGEIISEILIQGKKFGEVKAKVEGLVEEAGLALKSLTDRLK